MPFRLAPSLPLAISPGTRDSQAVLLLGSDGWVEHREGGVVFKLDVRRCMYSSGRCMYSSIRQEGIQPTGLPDP